MPKTTFWTNWSCQSQRWHFGHCSFRQRLRYGMHHCQKNRFSRWFTSYFLNLSSKKIFFTYFFRQFCPCPKLVILSRRCWYSCPCCPKLSKLSEIVHVVRNCPYFTKLSELSDFVHIVHSFLKLSILSKVVHIVRSCPNCPKLSILSKADPNVQKCPKSSKMSKNVQFMSKFKYVQNCPKTKSPIMSKM